MTLNYQGLVKLYNFKNNAHNSSRYDDWVWAEFDFKKQRNDPDLDIDTELLKSGTRTKSASFSPDGKLVTVDDDGIARIWDINDLDLNTEWRDLTIGITYNELLPTWIEIVDKKLESLKLTQ